MGNENSLQLRASGLAPTHFAPKEVHKYGIPGIGSALAYDAGQKILAVGTTEGAIKIYGGEGVECTLQDGSDCDMVVGVFFLRASGLLLSLTSEAVCCWDVSAGRVRARVDVAARLGSRIQQFHLCPHYEQQFLFLGLDNGAVHVLNTHVMALLKVAVTLRDLLPPEGRDDLPDADVPDHDLVDFAVSPANDHYLAIVYADGLFILFDLKERVVHRQFGRLPNASCLAWGPEGNHIAVGMDDGTISIWKRKKTDAPATQFRVSRHKPGEHAHMPIKQLIWRAPPGEPVTEEDRLGMLYVSGGHAPGAGEPDAVRCVRGNFVVPSEARLSLVTNYPSRTLEFIVADVNPIQNAHLLQAAVPSDASPKAAPPASPQSVPPPASAPKLVSTISAESAPAAPLSPDAVPKADPRATLPCVISLSDNGITCVSLPRASFVPVAETVSITSTSSLTRPHDKGGAALFDEFVGQIEDAFVKNQRAHNRSSAHDLAQQGLWPLVGGTPGGAHQDPKAPAPTPLIRVTGHSNGVINIFLALAPGKMRLISKVSTSRLVPPRAENERASEYRAGLAVDRVSLHLEDRSLVVALHNGIVFLFRFGAHEDSAEEESPIKMMQNLRRRSLTSSNLSAAAAEAKPVAEPVAAVETVEVSKAAQEDEVVEEVVEEAVEEEAAPEEATPEEAAPQESTPEAATPEEAADQAAPEEAPSQPTPPTPSQQPTPSSPQPPPGPPPLSQPTQPRIGWKHVLTVQHAKPLLCVRYSSRYNRLAAGDSGGTITLTNTNTGKCLLYENLKGPVSATSIAFASMLVGRGAVVPCVLFGLSLGAIVFYSADSGKLVFPPRIVDQRKVDEAARIGGRKRKTAPVSFMCTVDRRGEVLPDGSVSPDPENNPVLLLVCLQRQVHVVVMPTKQDDPSKPLVSITHRLLPHPAVSAAIANLPWARRKSRKKGAEPMGTSALIIADMRRQLHAVSLMDLRVLFSMHLASDTQLNGGTATLDVSLHGHVAALTTNQEMRIVLLFARESKSFIPPRPINVALEGVRGAVVSPSSGDKAVPKKQRKSRFNLWGSGPVTLQQLLAEPLDPPEPDIEEEPEATMEEQLMGKRVHKAKANAAAANADESDKVRHRQGQVGAAKGEMAEAVQRARRNVQKASEVAEKTEQMADDADNFASLAKQLKQKNKGWF